MKKKILLFEDRELIYESIKRNLNRVGYDVEIVHKLPRLETDEEFKVLLKRAHEFDLIIWDNEMQDVLASEGFVQTFKGVFKGPMIAHSACERSQGFLLRAGCTNRVDKGSGELVKEIERLLR